MVKSIRRRVFIAAFIAAFVAAAWPLAVQAQQPTMPVVGYLNLGANNPGSSAPNSIAGFIRGISKSGYVVGQNVTIEYGIARNDGDRLRSLAADMVRRRVRIIVADGEQAAIAAKAATETIPIIFLAGGDPVEAGLAASFNRPGGNVTGVTRQMTETTAKRLDLLHKLVPTVETIAVFAGGGNYGLEETRDLPTAASILGVRLLILHPRTASEVEGAFATLIDQRAGALLACSCLDGARNRPQIISLAARHGIPTMFTDKREVAAGGLASYGSDDDEVQYMVGLWAGRILKGEKPADLPIVQPTSQGLRP